MDAHPEEKRRARRKAMVLLEHMDRTEKALGERLAQAGFGEDAVRDAVSYVKSFGYIDDSRYARTYISGRMAAKSRQKILQELANKGVDRETALQAWQEEAELSDRDEREILRNTVMKKYDPGSVLDEKEMRRLIGFLSRRGFQYQDITYVLEELDIVKMYDECPW